MLKTIVAISVLCSILLGEEVFYGIEMNAKLKNLKTYKVEKLGKAFSNGKFYSKNLKNDYFDRISIYTNSHNIVYQIRLTKENIYEAQKVLNKLQKKYGAFSCSDNMVTFVGKVGDICKSIKTTKYGTIIELETVVFGKTSLFSVVYTSKYFYKILPKSKKEQKLDNNL